MHAGCFFHLGYTMSQLFTSFVIQTLAVLAVLVASPLPSFAQGGQVDEEAAAGEEPSPGSIFDRDASSIDDQMIEGIKQQPLNWHVGFSLMVANPQDSLRRALLAQDISGVGIGFALDAGYHFDPIPVALVGEFAMNFYGGQSRQVIRPGQFFNDTINYETLNLQIPVTFAARLQPNILTWVHPYVEGIGGFMVFNSNLSVDRSSGTTQSSDGLNESSASWVYGAGVGMMVKTADVITLPNALQRILVDVRFRYLRSSDVSIPYIQLNDDDTYVVKSSQIPDPWFVLFNLGITVQF